MIPELKPYPAYKDSGVPWLGEVPEQWKMQRLKQVCRLAYGDSLASEARQGGDVPVYGSNGRVGFHSIPNTLQPCLVIGRKGSFGKINFSSKAVFAIDTTYYVDSRTSSSNIRWLYYLLGWLRLDEVSRDSAIPGLSREDVYHRLTPIPPFPEQSAIVRYLDYMDRRIQRYIRAKQKLIKLLEEQKQAIVHQAVTGQIDVRTGKPYPKYKPSGVEWLGNVPEHWGIIPLKFLACRIQNGSTPPTSENAFYENGSVPWFGPSSCREISRVGKPVRYLANAAFIAGRARLIRGPALLVVVIGATAGRMTLLEEDGATNQQITSFELLDETLYPSFALYQLSGAEEWLRARASTATMPILDAGEVARLPIALPSMNEQKQIMGYANESTSDLHDYVDNTKCEIDLLLEYRTRLISDVITGKLDVREASTNLPEELEEELPEDQEQEDEENEDLEDEEQDEDENEGEDEDEE